MQNYKFCPVCGTKANIKARFCQKCGHHFTNNPNTQTTKTTKSNNQDKSKTQPMSRVSRNHDQIRYISEPPSWYPSNNDHANAHISERIYEGHYRFDHVPTTSELQAWYSMIFSKNSIDLIKENTPDSVTDPNFWYLMSYEIHANITMFLIDHPIWRIALGFLVGGLVNFAGQLLFNLSPQNPFLVGFGVGAWFTTVRLIPEEYRTLVKYLQENDNDKFI